MKFLIYLFIYFSKKLGFSSFQYVFIKLLLLLLTLMFPLVQVWQQKQSFQAAPGAP